MFGQVLNKSWLFRFTCIRVYSPLHQLAFMLTEPAKFCPYLTVAYLVFVTGGIMRVGHLTSLTFSRNENSEVMLFFFTGTDELLRRQFLCKALCWDNSCGNRADSMH